MESDSKQVASVLARADAAVDTTALGDPFLLGEEFRDVSASEGNERTFGEGFAKQIFADGTGPLAGTDFFGLRSSISSSSANG